MSESSTPDTNIYNGAVMLHHPPIDKPAALALLERAVEAAIPIAIFWRDKFCTPEQMTIWEAPIAMGGGNLFPIDIGDEKYHSSGFGSASERVAQIFELKSPGERKLVEVLNKNNKTGYLKGGFMSIAWTMRELYELAAFDQVDVINRVKDVVHAFVRVVDGEQVDRPSEEGVGDEAKLASFAKLNNDPFTPGRYMRDLWLLGESIEAIQAKVGYWIDGWKLARAEVDRAKVEYAALDKGPLTFVVGNYTCLKLATSDRVLVKVAGHDKAVDIRVVKNPDTGLAAVVARKGIDLSALAAALEKAEPGLWYYHRAAETLINGGVQYTDTPPTSLLLDELCELVTQHVG